MLSIAYLVTMVTLPIFQKARVSVSEHTLFSIVKINYRKTVKMRLDTNSLVLNN